MHHRLTLDIFWVFLLVGFSSETTYLDSGQIQSDPDTMSYEYSYSVDSPENRVWTHGWERARGDHVYGGYSLMEPGGSIRSVRYEVDGNKGFKAVVITRLPGSYMMQNIYHKIGAQPSQPIKHANLVAKLIP